MEMELSLKKICEIEEQVISKIDLLEIAKSYCDYHFEKGYELSALGTIISIILKEQKAIADSIDDIM